MNPNDSSILIAVWVIAVAAALALGYLCALADRNKNEDQPLQWNGKFMIVPGPVVSQSDGQVHFVDSNSLIRLYGVDPKDCTVFSHDLFVRLGYDIDHQGYVVLRPQQDGDYNIIRAFADANVLIPGEEGIEVYA